MRRAKLERVAVRVARLLGERDCVLAGGLAVAAHGYVRATTDVDFVTGIPLGEACARLKADGCSAELRRGDTLEGDLPCVRARLDGTRVDVMPPIVALEWERAIELPMGGRTRLHVVDLAGLLRLKLRAGGPKDLMDAGGEERPPARSPGPGRRGSAPSGARDDQEEIRALLARAGLLEPYNLLRRRV